MTDETKGMPDEAELERRKKELKDTLLCPYCEAKMSRWAVPQTMFTTWPNEFMYICFNDECPYTLKGREAMARMGNAGSYRLMYDPLQDCCQPVPVLNRQALRDGIMDEAGEAAAEKVRTGLSAGDVSGSWKLVSAVVVAGDGSLSYPFGSDIQARLVYGEDGTMTVQSMAADGALLAAADGSALALEISGAYTGRFELESGDTIRHHIENSLFPGWNGLIQERTVRLEGDTLTMITPMVMVENGLRRVRLTWRRA